MKTFLSICKVLCYGFASVSIILCLIGSGLSVTVSLVLLVAKLFGHFDHGYLAVASPILAVLCGWVLCGGAGLLGLICQVTGDSLPDKKRVRAGSNLLNH